MRILKVGLILQLEYIANRNKKGLNKRTTKSASHISFSTEENAIRATTLNREVPLM